MRAHIAAVDEKQVVELSDWTGGQMIDFFHGPSASAIDKSWEAVFPLVGSIAGTGEMLVDDPQPVGEDLGYGPAMLIAPAQVAEIAASLAQADSATIELHWEGLESPFMATGLYDDADGKEFAMWGYQAVAEVFASAAASSSAVLFAIM